MFSILWSTIWKNTLYCVHIVALLLFFFYSVFQYVVVIYMHEKLLSQWWKNKIFLQEFELMNSWAIGPLALLGKWLLASRLPYRILEVQIYTLRGQKHVLSTIRRLELFFCRTQLPKSVQDSLLFLDTHENVTFRMRKSPGKCLFLPTLLH